MMLQLRGSRSWSSVMVAKTWWICWRSTQSALLVTGVCLVVFLLGLYTSQIFMTSQLSSFYWPFSGYRMGGWLYLWFHLIRFGLPGVMFFCIVQQKEKYFPRYLYMVCWPVGVYLLGKLLDGIWVESWRWLQHFCSFTLVKILHILGVWEKKGRKHRTYGSDYSSLRFQHMAGRLFSGLCQVK